VDERQGSEEQLERADGRRSEGRWIERAQQLAEGDELASRWEGPARQGGANAVPRQAL